MDAIYAEAMTPELRAYLDYKGNGDAEDNYAERKRLRHLIQPGLLRAHHRIEIDASFATQNEDMTSRREEMSQSGNYKLVIGTFGRMPNFWSYTQGRVFRIGSHEPIATINRNYTCFPFAFIEGHPNGHDYLLCGEDYQGQTVIELDTGKRRDYLPDEADDGSGFCWAAYRFNAASQILFVDGCHWACPYEFRFFDFSAPLVGWPQIETDVEIDVDNNWPTVEPDGTIRCYQTEDRGDGHWKKSAPTNEPTIAAIQTFRREGLKLVRIEEWVSEKEKILRIEQKESERNYEQWLKDFKASDPLYVLMNTLKEASPFKPEEHISIGITHDQWCPHFKGHEDRICHRIYRNGSNTLEIEWGAKTGPIKLVVNLDGKHIEDKWFEHSTAGMTEAFTYAKSLL